MSTQTTISPARRPLSSYEQSCVDAHLASLPAPATIGYPVGAPVVETAVVTAKDATTVTMLDSKGVQLVWNTGADETARFVVGDEVTVAGPVDEVGEIDGRAVVTVTVVAVGIRVPAESRQFVGGGEDFGMDM